MNRLAAISCIMLCGCTQEWDGAPHEYRCDDTQMERVEHDTEWCIKTTEYFPRYCYAAAIMRSCTKLTEDKPL